MKICILFLVLFAMIGCGGTSSSGSNNSQASVPSDADLKADVMMSGSGAKRSIEVSFYYSRPVAPGVKTEPTLEVIPVDEAHFNDTQLTQETNAVGRTIYTAKDLPMKPQNLISIKLNGKAYEGKAIHQTTLESRSVSVVMNAK